MLMTLLCVVAVVAVGCTRKGDQPDTTGTAGAATSVSSVTATPTATHSAVEQAAESAATATYLNLQRTYDRAARSANYRDTAIDRYSGDPVRHQLHAYLFEMARSGIVQMVRGEPPAYAPEPVSVNLASDPPQIVIHDCPDSRDVFAVFKGNGRSAEPSGAPYQPHRKHPVTATVRRYGGRWLVVELGGSRAETC